MLNYRSSRHFEGPIDSEESGIDIKSDEYHLDLKNDKICEASDNRDLDDEVLYGSILSKKLDMP